MIEDRIRELSDRSHSGPQGVMADSDDNQGPQGNLSPLSFSARGNRGDDRPPNIPQALPPLPKPPPQPFPPLPPPVDEIAELKHDIKQLRWSVESLRETGDDFQIEYPVPGHSPWPWYLTSFGYKLKGATCTIYPGYMSVRGQVQASLAASSDLSLTGSTAWVYAEIDDSVDTTAVVGFSAARDDTSIGKIRKYLYRFDQVTATQYKLGMICNVGDVFLDTPA